MVENELYTSHSQNKLLNLLTCDFLTINFKTREASLIFLKDYELFSNRKLNGVFTKNYKPTFLTVTNDKKEKILTKDLGQSNIDVAVNYYAFVNKTQKETESVVVHHQLIFPGTPASL